MQINSGDEGKHFPVSTDDEVEALFEHDSDEEVDGDGITPVHFRQASKFSVGFARSKRNSMMNREHHLKNKNMPGAPDLVGESTSYSTTAKEMQRLKYSQEIANKPVNEQVRGELAGGKPAYVVITMQQHRRFTLFKNGAEQSSLL